MTRVTNGLKARLRAMLMRLPTHNMAPLSFVSKHSLSGLYYNSKPYALYLKLQHVHRTSVFQWTMELVEQQIGFELGCVVPNPRKHKESCFLRPSFSRLREISAKHLQVVSALAEWTPSPEEKSPKSTWSFEWQIHGKIIDMYIYIYTSYIQVYIINVFI